MNDREKEAVETSATGLNMSRASSLWYVLAIGLLAACALSFVGRAHSRNYARVTHAIQPVDVVKPSPVPVSQAKQPAVIIGGLGVTLTRQGFYPSKITRPPGRFVLAVVNKSGLDNLALSLDSPLGAPVRTKQLLKEEPQWADVYDLTKGRYILRETAHPGWVCEIIVN